MLKTRKYKMNRKQDILPHRNKIKKKSLGRPFLSDWRLEVAYKLGRLLVRHGP